VAGTDGNVAEPVDTAAVAVVVVVEAAAPEGQDSARNENHDSLDYTYFRCKLCIQHKLATSK